MMGDEEGVLHVPGQTIAPPTSISRQAQEFLAGAAQRLAAAAAGAGLPDQAAMAVTFLRPAAAAFVGTFETIDLPHGAKLYRAIPEGREGRKREVAFFDIHGGGFVAGGGEMCQLLCRIRAANYGVEVFAIDYRLAPAHAFPAALDDCMAAWRHILDGHVPSDLIVGGSSAGGNLAAAMLLRARDEGLPLPVALVLLTPALDMTQAGDSYTTNRYLDVNLYGDAMDGPMSYAGDHDPTDPYLSPLFGDYTKGWPPTFLSTGTRDLLLSDTVQMHRALRRTGIIADLMVTEAGPHGGFMGQAPEDMEVIGECRKFMDAAWGITA